MLKIKIYKIHINKLTEKNFGLIHVYFLYTVFRATYRAVISKVACLLREAAKKKKKFTTYLVLGKDEHGPDRVPVGQVPVQRLHDSEHKTMILVHTINPKIIFNSANYKNNLRSK